MYCPLRTINNVILYVEDDEITRISLGLIIHKRYPWIKLLSAANGKEGLEMFIRERPSLVITDILMPLMDGRQMIKKIRSVSPEVGIIVTSASCDVESFTNLIELDSRHYLCKPIDLSKLFDVIDEWMAGQGMTQENNRLSGMG